MTEKIYFIENTIALEFALDYIINRFACFVEREFVEMDFSKITLKARNEDLASIEWTLAPLV